MQHLRFSLLIVLLFFATFVTCSGDNDTYTDTVYLLPQGFELFASIIRWSMVSLIAIIVALAFKHYLRFFSAGIVLLFLFTFLLAIRTFGTYACLKFFVYGVMVIVIPLFSADIMNRISLKRITQTMLYLCLLWEVIAILTPLYSGSNIIFEGRYRWFTGNPNSFAVIAIFWVSWGLIGFAYQRFVFLSMTVMLIGCAELVLTGSRNGMVGLSLIILFFLFRFRVSLKNVIFLFFYCISIAIIFYLHSDIVSRFISVISAVDDTGRGERWGFVLSILQEYPWTGIGEEALYAMNVMIYSSHNSYLSILLCCGIPLGAIVIMCFLLAFFLLFTKKVASEYVIAQYILWGTLLAFCVMSFGECFVVYVTGNYTIYWLVTFGFLLGMPLEQSKLYSNRSEMPEAEYEEFYATEHLRENEDYHSYRHRFLYYNNCFQ